jgi:hypothetical protein
MCVRLPLKIQISHGIHIRTIHLKGPKLDPVVPIAAGDSSTRLSPWAGTKIRQTIQY